jgi:hypothetical protein
LLLRLFIAACLLGTTPAAHARSHGTPRHPGSIRAIVIHAVGGPACIGGQVRFRQPFSWFDNALVWQFRMKLSSRAEAHTVIGRAGDVRQVMPFTEVAHHTVGINDVSIGIELVHRGDGAEPFEEAQIAALIRTINEIRMQFRAIPLGDIVMHSEIDQRTCDCAGLAYRRRQDPGANFPMSRVIAAVREPGEPIGAANLPRLSGPAPDRACVSSRF